MEGNIDAFTTECYTANDVTFRPSYRLVGKYYVMLQRKRNMEFNNNRDTRRAYGRAFQSFDKLFKKEIRSWMNRTITSK